jgi:hypothetical protein
MMERIISVRDMIFQILSNSYERINILAKTMRKFDEFNCEVIEQFGYQDNKTNYISSLLISLIKRIEDLISIYKYDFGIPQIDEAREILFRPITFYQIYDNNISNDPTSYQVSLLDFVNEFQTWSYTLLNMKEMNGSIEFFHRKELYNMLF